jgi:Tubulin folding cofactor D C terminal
MLKPSFCFPSYSDMDWTSPADIYPRLVPMLAFSEYRFDLLTGLITSAGSRTESLVSHIQLETNVRPTAQYSPNAHGCACSYAIQASV